MCPYEKRHQEEEEEEKEEQEKEEEEEEKEETSEGEPSNFSFSMCPLPFNVRAWLECNFCIAESSHQNLAILAP